MEEIKEERGLSIAELFNMVKKHIIGIIVSFIVCCGVGLGYSMFLKPVSYTASTNVYVLYDNGNPNLSTEAINYGRLGPKTFATALENDVNIWKKIADKVAANNEFAENKLERLPSYAAIGRGLNASYDEELQSLIFNFSYTSSDPYMVAPVMNATLDVLSDITNHTNEKDAFSFFNLSYLGRINTEQDVRVVSTSTTKILLLAGIAGISIGIIYAILVEKLDKKVGNKKIVEELCDLKIVGLIPDLAEFENKGGKR